MKLQEGNIADNESYEDPDSSHTSDDAILIRYTNLADGQEIWRMVNDSGVLDPNSVYCYLLLCEHFNKTCLVAEKGGKLIGFVTAYILPNDNNILFIWQIGTVAEARGQGIAKKLILELLSSKDCKNINTLQATISTPNTASMALFKSIARQLKTHIDEREFFTTTLFPDKQHEQENLVTVGPFDH